MERGFIMPSLLRNFIGGVNSQKQPGKCQWYKSCAVFFFFPNKGEKKKERKWLGVYFRRALRARGKPEEPVLDQWFLNKYLIALSLSHTQQEERVKDI